MLVYEEFWKQLLGYAEKYGLMMVVFTITSGLVIGYISHYVLNVLPYKKRLQFEKSEEEQQQEDENSTASFLTNEQKQVGIVKGMINKDLVSSLRRRSPQSDEVTPSDPPRNQSLQMPLGTFHRSSIEYSTKETVSSDEDENLESIATDADLLSTLGNLHGKLATAQLRARTRKMQEDMTVAERDDEARAKAKQLESIMSLMMQNQEKFGISSEEDIKEQLDMYNF
ncbi:unnamed protein product [Nippostrongylus brasiliensis]|uniref:RIC3 domain-containing protein n=1 Tax=Nippostrongylus brasiliensis TaxID=27835 RepID=A0A0N4YAZ2_NIPBR|nr:unnamed protein product [Nippostrongylus brasiliensis]